MYFLFKNVYGIGWLGVFIVSIDFYKKNTWSGICMLLMHFSLLTRGSRVKFFESTCKIILS